MQTVGIIGAGLMGAGIAQVAAQAGMEVLLSDLTEEQANRSRQDIAKRLDRLVARGSWIKPAGTAQSSASVR